MLLVYALFVAVLVAIFQIPIVMARFPGGPALLALDPWRQLILWYSLFAAGFVVIWFGTRYVLRQRGLSQAEVTQRLTRFEQQVVLPLPSWLNITLYSLLVAWLIVAVLSLGIPTPTFFVLSIALLCYLPQLRFSEQRFRQPPAVERLGVDPPSDARHIRLRWTPPDDPGFNGVVVIRTRDAPASTIEQGVEVYRGWDTSYDDHDGRLEPGSQWHYTVFSRALGSVASGRSSEPAQVVPLPPDVATVTHTPFDRQIELIWAQPNGRYVAGTVAVRRPDRFPENPHDGEVFEVGNEGELLDDRQLQPATVYYYRLYCTDVFNQYSPGINYEAATAGPGVRGLQVSLQDGEVSLTWQNPGPPAPETIEIRRSSEGPVETRFDGEQVTRELATAWVDREAEAATHYFYGVIAVYPNAVFGRIIQEEVMTPPPPPPIIWNVPIPERTTIQLRWTNPDPPGFDGILIRRAAEGQVWHPDDGEQVYAGRGTTFTDARLAPDTLHGYSAFSVSGRRFGPPVPLEPMVRTLPRPEQVAGFEARCDAVERLIALDWQLPALRGQEVLLRRGTIPPPDDRAEEAQWGERLYRGRDTSYIDRAILAGTDYYYLAFIIEADNCPSFGSLAEVRTPSSFQIPVRLDDRVTGEVTDLALPEEFPMGDVLVALARQLQLGQVANARLFNRTQKRAIDLEETLLDAGVQHHDTLELSYDQAAPAEAAPDETEQE